MKRFIKLLFSPFVFVFQFFWIIFVGVPTIVVSELQSLAGYTPLSPDVIDDVAFLPSHWYKEL